MEHATDTASGAPAERADSREDVAVDHPAESGPRPSRWARLTGRLRGTDRPAKTAAPGAAAPAGPRPTPPAPPARITSAPVVQSSAARRIAIALAGLLAAVIAVAFRGSWTSQSDAAKASHFDDWGAWLYPFAPDGLIVLALVGAVVLRHKRWPRWYCLGVVALFTATSYVVNHLHGLGTFQMHTDGKTLLKALDPMVVGLISVQLVGAITFGSHILMHVFRHLFPEALDARGEASIEPVAAPAGPVEMSGPAVGQGEQSEGPAVPEQPGMDGRELARLVYGACLDGGVELSQKRLGELARISKRQAGYVKVDIDTERAEAAQEETAGRDTDAVIAAFGGEAPKKVLAVNGSAAASGPAGGA